MWVLDRTAGKVFSFNVAPSVNVNVSPSPTVTVAEGEEATVTVTLSRDPKRAVTVPLIKTALGGLSGEDYEDVPDELVFRSGESTKTFTFTATDDLFDDDGRESRDQSREPAVQGAGGALPPELPSTSSTTTTHRALC